MLAHPKLHTLKPVLTPRSRITSRLSLLVKCCVAPSVKSVCSLENFLWVPAIRSTKINATHFSFKTRQIPQISSHFRVYATTCSFFTGQEHTSVGEDLPRSNRTCLLMVSANFSTRLRLLASSSTI